MSPDPTSIQDNRQQSLVDLRESWIESLLFSVFKINFFLLLIGGGKVGRSYHLGG